MLWRNKPERPNGVEYALYSISSMVETKQEWKDSLRVCSFVIYGSFNDAISSSDRTASNGKMITE
jgi:hypothetical protein